MNKLYYGSVQFQFIKGNALQAGVFPVLCIIPAGEPAAEQELAQQQAIAQLKAKIPQEVIIEAAVLVPASDPQKVIELLQQQAS